MPTLQLPILLAGSAVLLVVLLGLWQQLTVRKLKRELAELRNRSMARDQLETPGTSFAQSLKRVEQQHPGFAPAGQSRTDKYRYVAALAGQGVDAKGIAAALQMSPEEVAQLLHLARLKHRAQG